MLGKLIKHEMKACARLLLPLYLLLIVLTILDRIVLGLNVYDGVLGGISILTTFVFILSDIVIAILSIVIVILRFYKNMITDEGYLMFTLPVKTSQLINSKLIAASIWTLGSVIAVISSMLFVFGTLKEFDEFWNELAQSWSMFRQELGSDYILFLIGFIIAIIFGLLCNILHIYASIAIGQLFRGIKILGSVIAYAAIGMVLQIVSVVVPLLCVLISGQSAPDGTMVLHVLMPVVLTLMILVSIALYWITNYIFNKKLNLE